ncbi:MAG: copper amine oxidase [Paenibacillus sp.]|nr:copper amine oxidase [Paenibacillus sp.]
MRKKWTIAFSTLMSVILVSGAVYAASDTIKLYVNGKLITPEVAPQIIDGSTMVPVRWISEALGAEVGWNENDRSVSVDWKEGDSLRQQINLLRQAIAPGSAEDAVRFWANSVKERNGAAQYAVLSPELQKQTLADYEAWNWVTGLSSPWVDSFDVVKSGGASETYVVTFKLKTSTGSAGEQAVKVSAGQADGSWQISGLDAGGDDALDGIVITPALAEPSPAAGTLDNPMGVSMIDGSTSWAWGNNDQTPQLLRSTDGGEHWSAASLGGLDLTAADMNRVKAYFADANTGWLGWTDGEAMHLARTTDGGASWQAETFKGYHSPVQFSFVDNQHGWLIAAGDAAMMHSTKIVYRTEDGGATWKVVSDNSESMIHNDSEKTGALPTLGSIAGMSFVDTAKGFATFDNPVSNTLIFYRTTDGGATWSAVSLEVPADLAGKVDYSVFSTPVFSGKNGVVALKLGAGTKETMVVYATSDGGNTWSVKPGSVEIAPGTPFEISFADASNGWLLQGADLYRTTNGGASWQKVKTNELFENTLRNDPGIRAFTFADSQHGTLIASSEDGKSGQTIETDDGGATWHISPLQGK